MRTEAAPRLGRRTAGPRVRARLRPLTPYLLVAPAVLFLVSFLAWPAVNALLIAFQTAAGVWTLENFQRLPADTDFALSIRNTVILVAIVIPVEFSLALLMAVLAQSRLRGRDAFLYFWAFPLAVSDLATGLVWLSIFTERGYLNSALQLLHLTSRPIGFLFYDNLAGMVAAVVIAETWRSISLVMIIIMSGIQGIAAEMGEAAAILGANAWRRFWHVTLPLLRPSLQVALILRTTIAFGVFAVVIALTGNGLPVVATKTAGWVYDARNYQMAAVYALMLLVLSSSSTLFFLSALRTPKEVFQR